MALSDQLLELSARAQQLEASAAAVKERDQAAIAKRKADLEASARATRAALHTDFVEAADAAETGWADQQAAITTSLDTLRQRRAERHAARVVKRADHAADLAEADALDDVTFAIDAITAAEYSVLDAVDARAAADAEEHAAH
ncbi:hypothetical protein [Curtobacterium sp. ISL-83]|uniref:hypothetical protein n=1 Tax=Curtobacterium sp. ISL-83 TaxID=2819145 RepID=UPI001BEB7D90|nr:hypothetical protein [Curtobacterium sp. ISL-83]MBT2501027.1 hypothetical protein [Curtobacterium sp. ISL-83]